MRRETVLVAALGALCTLAVPRAASQLFRPFPVRALDSAIFTEDVRSSITTMAGQARRDRNLSRSAQYSLAVRHDTVVVTIDTETLSESGEGDTHDVDMDAVIGARWFLTLDSMAVPNITERPVVTRAIAEVSDIGTAMDDFFPPPPPRLGAGSSTSDALLRKWRRLADSAGVQRYHLSATRHVRRTVDGDSVSVDSDDDVTETSEFAWDPSRGPVAWHRAITTNTTSRFAGRTVRAVVVQQITVRRTH